jgi:Concanavalin A-like lectin/glucanases superfamily
MKNKPFANWKKPSLLFAAGLALLSVRTASAVDYPTTILGDHPVAYYRLEEANASPTAADSSGNAFDGFITYVTQSDGTTVFPQLGVPGLFTNSALFAPSTGVGQGHIDVPVNSTINPTTDGTTGAPFSAEMWALATTQPGGFETPLDDSSFFNEPPPYGNSGGWNFYQTPGPASTWSFSLRPNPGFVGNGPAVVIGQWTHLVLTYDGTNTTFYVNGVAVGTYAVPQFLVNSGTADLLFGYGPATGQGPFSGQLDEVAIYNYALTFNQVTNHYIVGTNSITPTAIAPSFSSLPASTNAYSGVPVTFSSQAVGTAPLYYQWKKVVGGVTNNISGATNNNYTFTPLYPQDDASVFSVAVTNSAGRTNSPLVTLSVLTNLNLLNDPFSITRRVGGYAAFRTVANGAQPISYQWHSVSNAVDQIIPGATSDTLWLTNIQASASGNLYYAHVTGPFQNADGGQASLTVILRTNTAPVSGYSKVVMADSPVGYWRLDETNGSTIALDTSGSFDGAYDSSGALGTEFTFGYPSGIPKEIDTAIHVTNSVSTAAVSIPYALELNPVTGPWSYEFWIQPTSQDSVNFHTPISSEGNQNSGNNLSGWNIYQHIQSYWTWNIFNGGGGGSFTSEFVDHPVVPGQWYHMVLTDDGTNMVWYVNNRLVFSTTTAGVGFLPNGVNGDPAVAGGPITLAIRSDSVFGDWDGGIDELAVYNYVLSPAQISNHFLNTTHLTIATVGTNTVVTWPAGTLQISTNVVGIYTNVVGAASPYTNSTAGPRKFYRVQLQ